MKGVKSFVLSAQGILETANELFFKGCKMLQSCFMMFLFGSVFIFSLLVCSLNRLKIGFFILFLGFNASSTVSIGIYSILHLVVRISCSELVNSLIVHIRLLFSFVSDILMVLKNISFVVIYILFVLFLFELVVRMESLPMIL